MAKIVIFGGTTEGRKLVEYLSHTEVEIHTYVATEYGESLLCYGDNIITIAKRMGQEEMEAYFTLHHFDLVIDATHPYALLVSQNIVKACANTGLPYRRVTRTRMTLEEKDAKIIYVKSVEEAVSYLAKTSGILPSRQGAKNFINIPS